MRRDDSRQQAHGEDVDIRVAVDDIVLMTHFASADADAPDGDAHDLPIADALAVFDDVTRELLFMVRDRQGYAVTTAPDGMRGYDAAVSLRPDLIISDVHMPSADGVHMVRRVRDTGVAIIAIEHVMAAIMAISDRIVVVNSGRVIAEGPPEAIRRNPAVIEAYLGDEGAAQAA